MPSSHLILSRPFLLLPPIPPTTSLFQWVNSSHEVAKVSTGVSALASFLPKNTQDWSPLEWSLHLLVIQGTLKSLLQHHSSKASILWCSAFFTVQLSHDLIKQSINNISFSYFHLLFSMYEHVHALWRLFACVPAILAGGSVLVGETSFYCTSQILCCVLHQLKVCGNLALSKSTGAIFPRAFAHFVSLCHILVILPVFQTLHQKKHLHLAEGSDDGEHFSAIPYLKNEVCTWFV